jgi:hypothetical protein
MDAQKNSSGSQIKDSSGARNQAGARKRYILAVVGIGVLAILVVAIVMRSSSDDPVPANAASQLVPDATDGQVQTEAEKYAAEKQESEHSMVTDPDAEAYISACNRFSSGRINTQDYAGPQWCTRMYKLDKEKALADLERWKQENPDLDW